MTPTYALLHSTVPVHLISLHLFPAKNDPISPQGQNRHSQKISVSLILTQPLFTPPLGAFILNFQNTLHVHKKTGHRTPPPSLVPLLT